MKVAKQKQAAENFITSRLIEMCNSMIALLESNNATDGISGTCVATCILDGRELHTLAPDIADENLVTIGHLELCFTHDTRESFNKRFERDEREPEEVEAEEAQFKFPELICWMKKEYRNEG